MLKRKIFKKIIESPAVALDKTVDMSMWIKKQLSDHHPFAKVRGYWNILGPGLTTGAADDDPSGIATYSQQGAQTGFTLLWLAPLTFPLMAVIQEMCARIGIVTDRGLAANIRRHFPRWVLYICSLLLLCANILNLGADIGAMAKAMELLFPHLSFVFLIVTFTVFIVLLQVYTTYKIYARYLKWMALFLLAYVASALCIHPLDWHIILRHTVIPSIHLSKPHLFLITGILGTTISPYLFFWQTSQECEEKLERGKYHIETHIHPEQTASIADQEIKTMRVDVWSGMFLSNIVMFFIVLSCAATLFSHGIHTIGTAAEAAEALRPIAGNYVYFLFAIGIIGSGLLAIPVLAGSASYAISETFGWKTGLSHKIKDAYSFYGIIIISMIIGLLINFTGLDPIKALLYSAVLNGLIAPPILALIVLISSSPKIMGERVNHPLITTIGWFTTAIMALSGIATIWSSL